jgi:hypothetical protein
MPAQPPRAPRFRMTGGDDPFMPTVTDADQAAFAYFLSDPTCKSFRLTLAAPNGR